MEVKAKEFLSELHINVPDDWLLECVQFVLEDAGQLARQPAWAHTNIPKRVYQQWLESNLRELETSCLPPNLTDVKKTVIRGHFALQVNSLLDISKPVYRQCMQLDGVDRSNAEVSAEPEPFSQKKEKSDRMLKLEMTDGVQIIHGMEYEAIPFLHVDLPPGTKVLVFGAVECRRGIMFLTKANIKVLGGQVDDLVAQNSQRQLFRRILKLTDEPGLAVNPTNVQLPITAPPQTSVSQENASHCLSIPEDDYDSLFFDDFENFDMDQTTSATPKSHIPRPPLVPVNVAPANQVDFEGFDDDDDFE